MRRYFLILIMLWLPLQGTLAAAVSMCTHEESSSVLNAHVISEIGDQLHTISHEQPMGNNMTSNQDCEANTLCHASSTIITSARSIAIPPNSSSYTVSLISNSISFIPEQIQRPPLA